MSTVFISHISEDNKSLRKYVDSLLRLGIKVWIDTPEAINPDYIIDTRVQGIPDRALWNADIQKNLNAVDAVFIFWSKCASKKPSPVFRDEYAAAADLGKDYHFGIEKDVDFPLDIRSRQVQDLTLFETETQLDAAFRKIIYKDEHFKKLMVELKERELKPLTDLSTNPEYLRWREAQMTGIYDKQFQAMPDAFPRMIDSSCPVICIESDRQDKEFVQRRIFPDATVSPRALTKFPIFDELPCPSLPSFVSESQERVEYFELMMYTKRVRRPNMLGFSLDALILDDKFRIKSFDAIWCNYMENILTNHILSYRLSKLYLENNGSIVPSEKKTDIEWPVLSLKTRSEASVEHVLSVTSTESVYSLISVQAIVLFRREMDWHVVVARRNDKVAVAPGKLQFQPAGGFEVFGLENDPWPCIEEQFDLRMALIREFLEELAGDKGFTGAFEDIARRDLRTFEGYRKVEKLITSGRFHIHFLGVVFDLVLLRPEFSFAIVIERDEDINFDYSYETDQRLRRACWLKQDDDEAGRLRPIRLTEVCNLRNREDWHHSSLGLWKLFSDSVSRPDSWLANRYGLPKVGAFSTPPLA